MTPEQFERWKDFSIRMAKTCYARNRRPYVFEILDGVEMFFDDIESLATTAGDWLAGVHDWSNSDRAPFVCDLCTEAEEDWVPNYWSLDEDHYEQACRQWADPVRCCIRAGMDVAVAWSGGVIGCTAGDIRRMYPDGVPEWIARLWDDGETIEVEAVVPGVGFVPRVAGPSPKFEEMADSEPIWL